MKNYIKILIAVFFAVFTLGCESDDDQLVNLENLQAPSNLGATFQVTQDNSGLVTIIPTGEGATLYAVDFGDGSPSAEGLRIGETVDHVYSEGEYEVVVMGQNLNGETAQGSQTLTVSFLPPENLEMLITRAPEDNYTISVSATAENAAMFEVYFGEEEDEEPTPLMIDGTVDHTYENVGTYTVRVVALSGGEATTEVTQEVVISDPLYLPIDFESETLDYTFYNFGGGEGAGAPVVDNPDPDAVNPSDRVASYTKPAGSETWAGTNVPLDEPIDFSSTTQISMDVWSPISGADVILKVENLDNADIAAEYTATTTTSEAWETLTFDLSSIDPDQEYGRIVLFFNFNVPGTGETYYFDNIRTSKAESIALPLSFESETLSYNWPGFGGAGGAVVPNPNSEGINTSTRVTELNKGSGAETWAGISLDLDEPVDFSEGTTVRMKVWSPEANIPILFKLEDSGSEPNEQGNPSVFVEVIENTTTSNEWEEMSFDLTSFEAFNENESYDRVIVFYDFGNPGEGTTFYFDDITLSTSNGEDDRGDNGNGDESSEPSVAASAPTVAEENVISLFSDAYTDVAVDTWMTGWSVASIEEVDIAGNAVKRYSDLDFVGIETVSSPLDITGMTHFHTDIWTGNLTEFRVKLVDFGPNGVYDGGDDTEHEVVISNIEPNQWMSIAIPLSEFSNLTTRSNIAQLIFSGSPAGSGVVYIDNVYFYN